MQELSGIIPDLNQTPFQETENLVQTLESNPYQTMQDERQQLYQMHMVQGGEIFERATALQQYPGDGVENRETLSRIQTIS